MCTNYFICILLSTNIICIINTPNASLLYLQILERCAPSKYDSSPDISNPSQFSDKSESKDSVENSAGGQGSPEECSSTNIGEVSHDTSQKVKGSSWVKDIRWKPCMEVQTQAEKEDSAKKGKQKYIK